MSKPVKIAYLADTSDLKRAMAQAETALEDVADTAEKSGRDVNRALGATAEAADQTASASSQLAGGIGDLGGAFEATGFISEGTAQSLGVLEAGIMGVTGGADLLNLATEKIPGLQRVATATTNGLAAAKRGLGVAIRFAMGPVGLIIIAVTALIALFVGLYKNNEAFRELVDKVWAKIKDAIGATVEWLSENVPKVFRLIGRVIMNLPLIWLIRNFDKVRDVAEKVFNAVRDAVAGAVAYVRRRFNGLVDWFGELPERITDKVDGLWDGFKNGFKDMINTIIGWWNDLGFSIPGLSIAGRQIFDDITISTPNIPMLATGGIVTGPTLAIVGEAGPEAVVPLDRWDRGRGDVIRIHLSADTIDQLTRGRQVQADLDAWKRAGGRAAA